MIWPFLLVLALWGLLLHRTPNFQCFHRALDVMHPEYRSATLHGHQCGSDAGHVSVCSFWHMTVLRQDGPQR